MKKVIKRSLFLAGSVSLVLLAGVASAGDGKVYSGAECSFADNPNSAHHRIHHTFTNKTSSSEWITCPVIRDYTTGDISSAYLVTLGTISNVRFEQRVLISDSVTGWNAQTPYQTSPYANYIYAWYSLNPVTSWASYSIEAYLGSQSRISGYRVTES